MSEQYATTEAIAPHASRAIPGADAITLEYKGGRTLVDLLRYAADRLEEDAKAINEYGGIADIELGDKPRKEWHPVYPDLVMNQTLVVHCRRRR